MLSARVALSLLLMSSAAVTQQYTISTFAGGGLPVNIPGTSAVLDRISGIATDQSGNVFIPLSDYSVVLRWDAVTGVLTLVAGNGTPGFSGDKGPATSAQLNGPTAVAVDSAGNLYIADMVNDRVRKVSGGVITTVAGGGNTILTDGVPATSADLSYTGPVAVDSTGNLYIVEFQKARILKVSNGVLTIVTGNGSFGFSGDNGAATSAQLSGVAGVTVDSAGNLYIADQGNQRIRRVSNGVITTVAGNGAYGFSGDNGPASSAELNSPRGVAVDSAGNLYIADGQNYRIRKVSNGVITTVAGGGPLGNSGDGPATSASINPNAVAVDSAGNLYVLDDGLVRRVSNGVITTVAGGGSSLGDNGPATSAQLGYPRDVAVDSGGNVYIADTANDRIRKVSNGVVTTVAGSGPVVYGQGGYSGDNGPATSAGLSEPKGVAVDSAGNLYILADEQVRKVSNGVITTVVGNGTVGFSGDNGPATGAQLDGPEGIALDSTGNLYIADSANNRIREVSNGVITTVAGSGAYGFGGDNGPATDAQLTIPSGVTVDSAGNLYIADGRVRKVSNGVITTVAGGGSSLGDNGPATGAQLAATGVAVDSAGNLYISDSGYNRIRKVSNGVITTIAGNGTSGFSGDKGPAASAQLGPGGVAVDSFGNVYVTDNVNQRVRVLIPSGPSCSAASVNPTTFSPAASGGSIAVTIQTSASCSWAVQSLPQWITYSGNVVGTGPATITLAVAANSTGARSAIISIAGVSVSVSQAGAPGTSPSITAVANGASNLTGPIAPGEIVVLYGSGLGPAQITEAHVGTDGLFGTQLAGTGVSFNGIAAPMIYTSATQVAAVVPYGLSGGTAQVAVTYQGQTTAGFSVPIASSVPGLFTSDGTGKGQAAAVNQDNSLNTGGTPAKVGDVIVLFATGEGQTTPGGVDGKPATVPLPHPNLPVTVTIGGQTAQLQYAGGAPGEIAGLMQINAVIPSGIQTGNAVPVVVQVGNTSSPAGVTIAVRGN